MSAPPVGTYLTVGDVMHCLAEMRQPSPGWSRVKKPTHRQAILQAGVSLTSYKRLMQDPDGYWRSMEAGNLERLLKGLGFDLMVCVGPASLLKVNPRD